MKFLIKIEDFINGILIKILDRMHIPLPKFKITFPTKKVGAFVVWIQSLVAEIKHFIAAYKEIPDKKAFFKHFLLFPFRSFQLAPLTTLAALVATLASSSAIVIIYRNAYKIKLALKPSPETSPLRAPASVEVEVDPHGHHSVEAEPIFLPLENVQLQLFLEDTKKNRQVYIDVSLKLSSKSVRAFLKANESHVRDHLNTTIEPVIPNITQDPIGRQVIKDKIKDEINQLLEKEKIEGKCLEVMLTSAMSS